MCRVDGIDYDSGCLVMLNGAILDCDEKKISQNILIRIFIILNNKTTKNMS